MMDRKTATLIYRDRTFEVTAIRRQHESEPDTWIEAVAERFPDDTIAEWDGSGEDLEHPDMCIAEAVRAIIGTVDDDHA
jgi:hypothetical protein